MSLLARRRAMMGGDKPLGLAYSLADPSLWAQGVIATGNMDRGVSGPQLPTAWRYYKSKTISTKDKRLFPATDVKWLVIDSGYVYLVAFDASKKYIGSTKWLEKGQWRLQDLMLSTLPDDPAEPKDIQYDNHVKWFQFSLKKSEVISNTEGETISEAFATGANARLYY